jgi:hypothetical protein
MVKNQAYRVYGASGKWAPKPKDAGSLLAPQKLRWKILDFKFRVF